MLPMQKNTDTFSAYIGLHFLKSQVIGLPIKLEGAEVCGMVTDYNPDNGEIIFKITDPAKAMPKITGKFEDASISVLGCDNAK